MSLPAVVLAGGRGSRMRPLTDQIPKPALPVAGVPLLGRQLLWLASHGIQEVMVASGYRASVLRTTIGDGSAYGLRVRYAEEPQPLGTGGALAFALHAAEWYGAEHIVVTNGDQLTGHDLAAQLTAAAGTDLSIHVRPVDDARGFGLVAAAANGRVSGFAEKPDRPVSGLVNAGTYIVGSAVLQRISAGESSLERDVFPAAIDAGLLVTAYVEQAYCLDVGTPAALVRATVDAVTAAGLVALIDPEAQVAADAVVEGGSWIGPGAVVAPGARVVASAVLAGAQVGPDAVLTRVVVGPGSTVAGGTTLADTVV